MERRVIWISFSLKCRFFHPYTQTVASQRPADRTDVSDKQSVRLQKRLPAGRMPFHADGHNRLRCALAKGSANSCSGERAAISSGFPGNPSRTLQHAALQREAGSMGSGCREDKIRCHLSQTASCASRRASAPRLLRRLAARYRMGSILIRLPACRSVFDTGTGVCHRKRQRSD